jgi:aerobic-type carbon monoxide dehydrogenase small subunit (CoxS/CutS family)
MEEMTINSCLTLLGSIDRCAITTTEGLGNQRTGLHPIHERLSGFHASQCGYCTPGMTMAIYGCLRKCAPATTHEPCHENGHEKQRGLSGLTDVDAERAVSGNICRCTGYRPILDACKSFASNVDLEDLGINEFTRASKGGSLPYDLSLDPVFPQFLLEDIDASERHVARYPAWVKGATGNASAMDESGQVRFRHVESGAGGADTQERLWITATKMEEVFDAMAKYEGERKVKLVVGNTSAGYYKHVNPEIFIDISQVKLLPCLSYMSLQEDDQRDHGIWCFQLLRFLCLPCILVACNSLSFCGCQRDSIMWILYSVVP